VRAGETQMQFRLPLFPVLLLRGGISPQPRSENQDLSTLAVSEVNDPAVKGLLP